MADLAALSLISLFPTATGGVLSGGILGRIQLANAIES
jgi:hypothetical protein